VAEHNRVGADSEVRPGGDRLVAGEREQLGYALETRFAPHLEAAALIVREAEQGLGEAQERLDRAERAAADERYSSDRLVFMRASVTEEVEGMVRKTTPKKLRAGYRFLLDRAVELAAGELQRFHDDLDAARQEREGGIEACRAAVQQATERLTAARETRDRVVEAERAARQGLGLLVNKLSSS
jgi:hypothetical protein